MEDICVGVRKHPMVCQVVVVYNIHGYFKLTLLRIFSEIISFFDP